MELNTKKLNIINYNEFTRSINHWNPYEEIFNNSLINNNEIYILGPLNDNKLRYLWNFSIKTTLNGSIQIFSIENTNENDPCIDIQIKKKTGTIKYINRCGNYRGKDLIKWMIEIMKRFGCEKCCLIDMAELKCRGRNKNNYVPLSLIHKLWTDKTYYEDFGFIPYQHKNNNNNTSGNSLLLNINNKIKKLQEKKWDQYNINDEKWIIFKEKYYRLYPSPFFAFREFKPENCGEFYDILYFLDIHTNELSEVKKLISKSKWIKIL